VRGLTAGAAIAHGCRFSLDHYVEILGAALAQGYRCLGFLAFLCAPPAADEPTLLLRHDVDLSLDDAVTLAEQEARLGVRATYFVRVHAERYNPFSPSGYRCVQRLLQLGCEVGLHYEVGHFAVEGRSAEELLAAEKAVLEAVTGVAVVGAAAHLPKQLAAPLERATLTRLGLRYEAGEERFNLDTAFFSDSNRVLRNGCPLDVIGRRRRLYFTAHPYWWVHPNVDPAPVVRFLQSGS
jgi:hypothetical protein